MSVSKNSVSLGLDFGTESVRAVLIGCRGEERATGVAQYRHGQIVGKLPPSGRALPPVFALQHPTDWLDAAARAVRSALRKSGCPAADVIGVGVDFTSCTM